MVLNRRDYERVINFFLYGDVPDAQLELGDAGYLVEALA